MSKLNEKYPLSIWSKIENFVNGTEIEKNIADDLEINTRTVTEFMDETDSDIESISLREEKVGKKNMKLMKRLYVVGAVLMAMAIMAILIFTVSYMPPFGQAGNPVNNEVPKRYIEQGMQETGTVNVVTGLILNYRGFDTMGETHVLFIAATTVMILLLMTKKGTIGLDYKEDRSKEPKTDPILQMVARFLVPVIAVFGIYVILNGHISPGGGFSGGAILGSGMILYVSAFGFKKTEKFFNEEVYKVAKVSALCCYVCCLSYYFYMGANGFDNHIPLGTPGAIISSGLILFIDIFVGTEVACTMYAFYALFRRGEI